MIPVSQLPSLLVFLEWNAWRVHILFCFVFVVRVFSASEEHVFEYDCLYIKQEPQRGLNAFGFI